ncbi:hypothetical protein T492DRAFT_1103341 [Pavlovales sp. CCMP2436]|nr:hypothetical protein T492DRAFT_1103341 [Pavlovales sp. CCMP2436]
MLPPHPPRTRQEMTLLTLSWPKPLSAEALQHELAHSYAATSLATAAAKLGDVEAWRRVPDLGPRRLVVRGPQLTAAQERGMHNRAGRAAQATATSLRDPSSGAEQRPDAARRAAGARRIQRAWRERCELASGRRWQRLRAAEARLVVRIRPAWHVLLHARTFAATRAPLRMPPRLGRWELAQLRRPSLPEGVPYARRLTVLNALHADTHALAAAAHSTSLHDLAGVGLASAQASASRPRSNPGRSLAGSESSGGSPGVAGA